MTYTYEAIGQRIKTERERLKLSQTALAELLNLAENSRIAVGAWEHGRTFPCLEHMKNMCEIFDCELDYLFGVIDKRTRSTTDICAITGLSEEAVLLLSEWRDEICPTPTRFVKTHTRAVTILRFVDELLCSSYLEELASCARLFQECLSGSVKTLNHYVHNPAAISAEINPETDTPQYVQQMTEIKANTNSVLLYEYQAKELLGEFMERLAGESKHELHELQDEFNALCERLDEDGTH